MRVSDLIREERLNLGLTQMALASQAGVSLPALQHLEAGTSNPSLETIERLGGILGLELRLAPRACDWGRLSALGLPLAGGTPQAVTASENLLVGEIRLALRESADERRQEALAGLLLAIREYFPTIFKRAFGKNTQAVKLIGNPGGRVIKLKRLAAARISDYL